MNKVGTLLKGIDTLIVRVGDIMVSKAWYEEKLGLTSVWQDVNLKLAALYTNGTTSLSLWQTDSKISIDKETASYPIFKTENATALRMQLLASDVAVDEIVKDEHVTSFFFFDPDGNVLEACEVHQ